jgi:acetyl esterase/lipase/hemerythrin superfamily protein
MANEVTIPARCDIETRDIEYRRQGGAAYLARLYQPKGAGPFPALVEVHGGAWASGDRLNNAPLDEALAKSGIVVLAIDFRMSPAHRYPDSIADINYATRWLKAHAAEFNSRHDLVGGLGTSSGGHQLLLSALKPSDPRYAALPLSEAPSEDARLPWIVLPWPISDPLARYRMAKAKGNDRLVQAHDAYWASEAEMAEGNPLSILERGEPAMPLPPAIVVQGTAPTTTSPRTWPSASPPPGGPRAGGSTCTNSTASRIPSLCATRRARPPAGPPSSSAISCWPRPAYSGTRAAAGWLIVYRSLSLETFMPTNAKTKEKRKTEQTDRRTQPKRDDKTRDTSAMNALDLLKNDHREVQELFDEFDEIDDNKKKQQIAQKLCMMLSVHAQMEEEIFYPEVRKATKDNDLIDEALVEHASAKHLIEEIEDAEVGHDLFDAKVKVLQEQMKRHIMEEEEELFPEVSDTKIDLDEIGARMAKRKDQLLKEFEAG